MGNRKVIQNYYADLNNLIELLGKSVNIYRTLIGGAHELNSIAIAHRKEVKDALDKVDSVGRLIDDYIRALKCSSDEYLKYCKIKSDLINQYTNCDFVQVEIDTELRMPE